MCSPKRGTPGARPTASPMRPGCQSVRCISTTRTRMSLLAELVRRHIRDGADEISKRLVSVDIESQSVEERTRMFVEATVALHRGNVALHRVLFEESPRPPDVVEELRQFESATVAAVEQLIADDPAIQVRDPHLAAYITVSTIESVTHHYASAHPDDADWDAFTDELVRLVVGYLHPGQSGSDALTRGNSVG